MNREIIKEGLFSALYLLCNEVESVIIPELRQEYLESISKIEIALNELNENG